MPDKQPEISADQLAVDHISSLPMRIHRILWSSIRLPMRAAFHYDPRDPLTVSVCLHPPESPAVTWVISRDLLYEGTQGPTGIGDVRLWPSLTYARSVVCMQLESRGMAALFEVSLPHLEGWLLNTFSLVPPGTELDRTNWDLLVERLLDDA
ncbi:SsgA family sporulation/cell division regulator [Streptomyces sp. PSKA54]|uniref:SsgA family sporulation/cell division regulator n=1 Tax=Streptomyces himalayensis subsp. aureolus TaxID=2758039 RepID=A0A7W2DA28_9ACTN|nr:SsgA family sporulation/cell division regulator [Streptomyces himalayensis]MBA4867295.1 SsgA family sporulation/cell division regulator [Streptomyces himalayensis subsp. aureolus]